MEKKTIGSFIAALRRANGLTQKELAEKTGIRPPTISAICLGTIKQLPIEGLNKICKALDCQPSDLMEYIEDSAEDTPESAE